MRPLGGRSISCSCNACALRALCLWLCSWPCGTALRLQLAEWHSAHHNVYAYRMRFEKTVLARHMQKKVIVHACFQSQCHNALTQRGCVAGNERARPCAGDERTRACAGDERMRACDKPSSGRGKNRHSDRGEAQGERRRHGRGPRGKAQRHRRGARDTGAETSTGTTKEKLKPKTKMSTEKNQTQQTQNHKMSNPTDKKPSMQ